ncbi:hypothetical protein Droror1_Dr00020410 [Drosera rotundifolia]
MRFERRTGRQANTRLRTIHSTSHKTRASNKLESRLITPSRITPIHHLQSPFNFSQTQLTTALEPNSNFTNPTRESNSQTFNKFNSQNSKIHQAPIQDCSSSSPLILSLNFTVERGQENEEVTRWIKADIWSDWGEGLEGFDLVNKMRR